VHYAKRPNPLRKFPVSFSIRVTYPEHLSSYRRALTVAIWQPSRRYGQKFAGMCFGHASVGSPSHGPLSACSSRLVPSVTPAFSARPNPAFRFFTSVLCFICSLASLLLFSTFLDLVAALVHGGVTWSDSRCSPFLPPTRQHVVTSIDQIKAVV
jgi:hypothetical protein